ncbi:U2surp [Symbiodinium pilosum]|uniref:U2surp protein n=1 Tax=Symbiodinium pilosum TaxID=2952 RepID=A0A812YDH9_SYMPI|nr:U2surp [Symbiodinium pilosum]
MSMTLPPNLLQQEIQCCSVTSYIIIIIIMKLLRLLLLLGRFLRRDLRVARAPLTANSSSRSLLCLCSSVASSCFGRKRLREEVDSLLASSPQEQELSYVEGFLVPAQADGHIATPSHHQQQQTGPLTSAEGQDTNNLYVGSLSPEWTEELISREFGRFGEITSIKIMYPRNEQQRQRGMNSGFVQFKTRAQAEYARLKLNGKEYFGMCLRIDWGRAIQPVRNIGAIMGLTPSVISKPALMPHIETPQPLPMITAGDSSPQASSSSERKSRWNLAKTLVVKVPEDEVLKKLIDKTAEFVADEGWDFEKLLLDKEKDNPRFSFMSTDKENLEDSLHVYYRWRTFSFSQGDNDIYWRAEPFQIYENGPLWQPPPCEKRVEAVPDSVQRIELALPSASGGPAFELLRRKLSGSGANVSTSGKDNVIGFNRGAGGQQFRALLGFNEPDIHSQAHMNPWHAAAIWPEVEQVARNYGVQTLVSPAMCGDIGKGTSWMQQFLDACKGCRIDAIAIHSYWCSLDGVRNLVQQYKRFGKKIWLTEFACAAPGVDVSMQGQIKFMKDVVPYLEQEDMVEKYAWFSYFTNEWSHGITNPNPDAGLVDWNGALSELGRVYVSLGHRRLEGNATIQDVQPNVTQPIFP